MELRRIEVDHNYRERIHFKDASFPVDICRDEYNTFVDGTMNCHWHNEFEYGVVLSGRIDYYMNDKHMALKKGDCIFVNSNVMHMGKQAEGCNDAAMFTVVFPYSLITGGVNNTLYSKYFQPLLNTSFQGFVAPGEKYAGSAMMKALEELYALDYSDFGFELSCLSLLSQIWHETLSYIACNGIPLSSEQSHRHEERAKRILSFIHEHYAENITVEDIAHNVNISRSECFRCFKRITNKKPVEYINEYRLARAAGLLHETNEPVSEICVRCGFGSSSYFGKLFKEKFGVTPLKFRNDSKNNTNGTEIGR